MSKTLPVDEKSIAEFLSDGEKNSFLIPDYQRKYDWEEEDIELLFNDIAGFTDDVLNERNSSATYFLGTIVSFINDDKEREIINGQQRIVSLLLLLRAIYTKLSEQSTPSAKTKKLMEKIEPVIWQKTDKMMGTIDFGKNYIRSKSIDDNYKDVLSSILSTGQVKARVAKDDCYSNNYLSLQKKYDKLYSQDQSMAEWFLYYLLDQTIVFSIEASTRDAALTIFTTINNRGKSLSDTDIIRAKIYSFLKNDDAKRIFNDKWEKLLKRIRNIGDKMTMTDIWSYYVYYVRAIKEDSGQTNKGLKKYFTQESPDWLKDRDVLQDIDYIVNVWEVAIKHKELDGESWSKDILILEVFDILQKIRNRAWRGATVVYYLVHRSESEFQSNFLQFMRKLLSQYLPLYILNPGSSTFLRNRIFNLNVSIVKEAHPRFDFQKTGDNDLNSQDTINRLKQNIKLSTDQVIRRALLKNLAYGYDEQCKLLPENFEIEHIMPRQWHATYPSEGYTEEKINEYVEQIGNLTPFEPKLNKKTSNALFAQKKKSYKKSSIAMTRELINEPDEWTPDAIAARSEKLADSLIKLWQKWSDDYDR